MSQSDDQELVNLVTRGFDGLERGARERDSRVSVLSDKMIGVEFRLEQLTRTAEDIKEELRHAEIGNLTSRVHALEAAAVETKERQKENAKWIKGLVASVIMLLLGFLLNFIRITIAQR